MLLTYWFTPFLSNSTIFVEGIILCGSLACGFHASPYSVWIFVFGVPFWVVKIQPLELLWASPNTLAVDVPAEYWYLILTLLFWFNLMPVSIYCVPVDSKYSTGVYFSSIGY